MKAVFVLLALVAAVSATNLYYPTVGGVNYVAQPQYQYQQYQHQYQYVQPVVSSSNVVAQTVPLNYANVVPANTVYGVGYPYTYSYGYGLYKK